MKGIMKKYILILMLTAFALNAQNVVTKYNKYMYGGGPQKVWWDSLSEEDMEKVDGEDSDREDAAPHKAKGFWHYTINEIPLPYFFDKRFAENCYKRYRTQISKSNMSLPPSHATSELGAPSSQEFRIGEGPSQKRLHLMTYLWSGDIYSDREYIFLNGKLREIFGVRVLMVKTIGDYSKNDAKTAARSKWLINDASLVLHEPLHCILNMCNIAFPCSGHNLPRVVRSRIKRTRTIAEQAFLQEAYAKHLESKYAKSEKLRSQLEKESKYHYQRSLSIRGGLVKK